MYNNIMLLRLKCVHLRFTECVIPGLKHLHRRMSSSRPTPQFFLESGDLDSNEEEILPPKVKSNENIITVPIGLQKRLDKRMIKENTKYFERQKIINASRKENKSRVIVHCKNSELNHYYGQSYERQSYGKQSYGKQSYGKQSTIPLASKGWAHRRSAGDFFTIKSQTHELSAFGFGDESSNFESLGLEPNVVDVVRNDNILSPTLVQVFAIPELLKRNNCLVAAETGCGKTLAYLLPLFQQILIAKSPNRIHNQPLAVVLTPTRELADQVYNVALSYGSNLGVKVRLLQGGNIGSKIKDPATGVVDILISTVNVASTLTSVGVFDTSRVEHIVLDEADTLLDDSFSDMVITFLRRFQFHQGTEEEKQDTTQITLVSATLPRSAGQILEEIVPVETFVRITTPDLHKVLAHVPQTFLRIRKSQKPEKILEIAKKDVESQTPLMIFCNKNATCEWLSRYLNDNHVDSLALHGKKHIKYRRGIIDTYQRGHVNVISCTDLGSRGIDTLNTGHVLNYDFPNFLADYIHRCGRTGRVGSTMNGRVTNFISKPHEIDLVQEIERSVRMQDSLEKVNANIKRILNARYGMYQPILPPEDEKQ